MDNTRIIELFIDDEYEEAGIEAISLVSKPAHDEEWMAFNSQKQEEVVEEFSPYKIVADDFCNHNPKLDQLGEPYSFLIEEGWEIIKMEKITPLMVQEMNRQRFSDPNDTSFLDNDKYRIRFKYVGPRDEKNREFCAQMLSFNRVYRQEDIDELTDNVANEEFGFYNIFLWRGSFNCRHTWVKLWYAPTGQIRNSGSSTKGLEKGPEAQSSNIQPDTRNDATVKNPGPKSWKPGMPRTGPNLFAKKDLTEMTFGFDDEKKIVVGAAMVPNKMIHRYDELGNLYYVFFSAASIKKMADKFMQQKRTDETSIEHNGRKLGSDKVYIAESWVSDDPIYDKSHSFGFSLPAGTWFVSMKVNDDKVWKMIKDKSLTGFSVEGLFAEKSLFSKEDKQINQIRKILKSITDEQ